MFNFNEHIAWLFLPKKRFGIYRIVSNFKSSKKLNSTLMFKDIFSFYGRIRRTEFALTYILYLISIFVITAISESAGSEALNILLLLPVFIFIAQGAKRCHDLGNSGWWMLIPFYIFVMLFASGDYGPNEYGDNPKGEGNDDVDPFGHQFNDGRLVKQPLENLGSASEQV
jgi:uncharacterized membrane protein YhaH (DUF805 family)